MNTHAYIARKPCGCVVGATVDEPQRTGHTSQVVAEWILRGMAVERVTVEEARKQFVFCTCQGKHQ